MMMNILVYGLHRLCPALQQTSDNLGHGVETITPRPVGNRYKNFFAGFLPNLGINNIRTAAGRHGLTDAVDSL